MNQHTLDSANNSEDDSEYETYSESDESDVDVREEWLGYLETEISLEVSKKRTNRDSEYISRTFFLSHNDCLKYYVQGTCRLYIDNSKIIASTVNLMNTCCCSGILINGKYDSHDFESEYNDLSDQNSINRDITPYRCIIFCSECLDIIEKDIVTKCFDGRCKKKPGLMRCLDYVFNASAMSDLVQPFIIYSDPMGICDTCVQRCLDPSDSME